MTSDPMLINIDFRRRLVRRLKDAILYYESLLGMAGAAGVPPDDARLIKVRHALDDVQLMITVLLGD